MEKTNSTIRFVIIFLIVVGSHGQTHMGKYIAKNYFDKFDRFVEREFDNFIANEIPLGLSEVIVGKNYPVPTLSSHLQRGLSGEGSHRRLSSSIGFKLQSELKSELTAHSCEVVIIERLPLGVFGDPFELHHLVECDVFSGAAVFGDTNLELPSFRSNQSVVEIRMSVDSKVLSRSEGDAEVHLDLPLHARYRLWGMAFRGLSLGNLMYSSVAASTEMYQIGVVYPWRSTTTRSANLARLFGKYRVGPRNMQRLYLLLLLALQFSMQ